MGKLVMYTVTAIMAMDYKTVSEEYNLFSKTLMLYTKHLKTACMQPRERQAIELDLEQIRYYVSNLVYRMDVIVDQMELPVEIAEML
jgi:hypothetical protein